MADGSGVTTTTLPTLLLAEDDNDVARSFVRLLRNDFDVVGVVADGNALIELVNQLRPDAILSDIDLQGLDGISATSEIRQRHPTIPVVLITGHDDPLFRSKGLATGASAFLAKPAEAEFLIDVLQHLLRRADPM